MASADGTTYGSAKYHGTKSGGVHHWTYPEGQWTERKVGADQWDLTFTSLKRRNRKAPEGSGAPVGSGFHWLVVAHQWVDKLDANTYATQMEGRKYLLAFRTPDWPLWNTLSRNARRSARDRTIAALRDMVRQLEAGDEGFENVIDQAALVDLAATYESEEGLPAGASGLASRLVRMALEQERRTARRVEGGKAEELGDADDEAGLGEPGSPLAVRPRRRPRRAVVAPSAMPRRPRRRRSGRPRAPPPAAARRRA